MTITIKQMPDGSEQFFADNAIDPFVIKPPGGRIVFGKKFVEGSSARFVPLYHNSRKQKLEVAVSDCVDTWLLIQP